MGTGMEETAQLTMALKFLPMGKDVALITDARFSGVSTGPCVGHVSPEALEGGPIGKLRDGDRVRVVVDTRNLEASIDLAGHGAEEWDGARAAQELASRTTREDIAPDPDLPADTAVWARLQSVSGGLWGGCVHDPAAIMTALAAGNGSSVG
jgi:dihydroxyacid dehydratase/phosphogluconate dehydratase